jgi:hypothetical protein
MKKRRMAGWGLVVAMCLFILFWLAIVGGIIYVVLHFVAKFW